MVITAINNVSLKSNYNVNFGAKKKQEKHQSEVRQNTSTLKAIPLATLIALSPLASTETYAQSNDKLIDLHELTEGDKVTNLRFISTDGDDSDAERFEIEVMDTHRRKVYDKELGRQVETKRAVVDHVKIDSFKVKDVTIKYLDLGKTEKRKSYFVVGDVTRVEAPQKAADGSGKIYADRRTSKGQDLEYGISEDMYNYLKEVTEGKVPEKTQVINTESGYTIGL